MLVTNDSFYFHLLFSFQIQLNHNIQNRHLYLLSFQIPIYKAIGFRFQDKHDSGHAN